MTQDSKARNRRDDFRIREYEAVLDRIVHARADVARVETVYPFAIAAIYAWIFTNPPAIQTLWTIALVLPVGIALLGIVRLYSRRQHMALLETYVRELESEIYGDSGLGWERRYRLANPLKGLIWIRGAMAAIVLTATIWIAAHSDQLFREWQAAQIAPKANASAVGHP